MVVGHELEEHEVQRWSCPVCGLPLAAGGPVELTRAAARHWLAWTETHGAELPADLAPWLEKDFLGGR